VKASNKVAILTETKSRINDKTKKVHLTLKRKNKKLAVVVVVKKANNEDMKDTSTWQLKNRRWDSAIPDDLLPAN
ncbi:MAG: hypothetical protein ORN24_04970, partial [Burkholderiales bacterium]|nr:hypothetical protein [Burkholderiales bacterium]